jgi:hypothetical protein
MQKEAFESGQAARREGKPRECPFGDYPSKSRADAWFRGFDYVEVKAPEPVVRVKTPEVNVRKFWPEDKALPEKYMRVPGPPCQKCRAIELPAPSRSQAVVVLGQNHGFAYLWCRACQHKFKLPMK